MFGELREQPPIPIELAQCRAEPGAHRRGFHAFDADVTLTAFRAAASPSETNGT